MDNRFTLGDTGFQITPIPRLESYGRNTYLLGAAVVLLIIQWVLPAYLFSRIITVLILGFIGYRSLPHLPKGIPIEKFPDKRLSRLPEVSEEFKGQDDEHKHNSLHPAIRLRADLAATQWQVPMEFHQLNQKALLLQAQGLFEDSKIAFETAVQLIEDKVPKNHPAILVTRQQTFRCMLMLGRPKESLPLLKKSVQAAQEAFVGDHPWTLQTWMDLAQCHKSLFELEDAALCAKEALQIVRNLDELAGRREMSTVQIEIPVIELLFLAGRFQESLQVAEECQSGLKTLRDDDVPNFDAVVVSLHEARALIFLNEGAKATEITKKASIVLTELKIDPNSPPGFIVSALFRSIATGMLNYGLMEENFDAKEKIAFEVLNTVTSEAAIMEATNTMVSGALCKAYRRKFQDSSRILNLIIPRLAIIDKGPRIQHLLTTLLLGIILCYQFRFLEAEGLVFNCCNRISDYFGHQSPEHTQSLILYGFIQLHRGKFNLSIATFKVASRGLKQGNNDAVRATSIPLVQLYMAFGYLCLGKNAEAKTMLTFIHDEEVQHGGVAPPVSRLTARCLGNICALGGNFTQAISWFELSLVPEISESDRNHNEQDLVGNTMCRWGLAWAFYEKDDIEAAGKLLVNVEGKLKSKFGSDHKLTIASTHDLLWVNRYKIQVAEELSKLYGKSLEVLGKGHSLTRKIKQSMALCPVAGKETQSEPKRIWVLGESGDQPTQISDVDWLTWSWDNDHNYHDKFVPKEILRRGSDLHDVFPYHPEDTNTRPRFPRKLDPDSFRQMTTFITKVLLEFPRDFSPAFVEAIYSTSDEVPYNRQRKLGRAVLEVRDPVTDQVYARKYLRYSADVRAKVHKEVSVMRKLSHPHIVKLCCSFAIPSEGLYALLIQPVAEYDLNAFLQICSESGYIPESLDYLSGWFPCLLSALEYLHSRNIKHRDIKLDNILVKENIVYFTDFGSAKDWSDNYTSATKGNPSGYTDKYRAPEVVDTDDDGNESRRTKQVDIFALGCVFAEIATVLTKRSVRDFDVYRLKTCDTDDFSLCLGEAMDKWMEKSLMYNSFIKEMMAKEARERPSPGELLSRLENGISGGYGALVCSHKPNTTDKA